MILDWEIVKYHGLAWLLVRGLLMVAEGGTAMGFTGEFKSHLVNTKRDMIVSFIIETMNGAMLHLQQRRQNEGF